MSIDKVILGTAQLGFKYGINNNTGKPSSEIAFEILETAYENGINYLDTAEAYGNAQEIIGSYQKNSGNDFNIITKLNEDSLQNSPGINEIIDTDRKLLNAGSLYGYLFHNIRLYQKYFDKEIFHELKHQKKIKKVGVSVYTNEEVMKVAGDSDIDIVQLPFNLLDNMNLRGDVLKLLKEKNKEVHVRSVFLQGLFFTPQDQIPLKLQPLKNNLQEIGKIAGEMDLTIQQLALLYVLQNEFIDKILIGVDTVDQLKEHIIFFKSNLINHTAISEKINSIFVAHEQLLNPVNWVN